MNHLLTSRMPYTYVVPENFRGWVRVVHYVQGAPALAVVHGRYYVEVPASGIVVTSTGIEEGYAIDKFFARSGRAAISLPLGAENKGTGLIWANGIHTDEDIENGLTRIEGRFFVGSFAEFERTPPPEARYERRSDGTRRLMPPYSQRRTR
jgi:hypothetical protein